LPNLNEGVPTTTIETVTVAVPAPGAGQPAAEPQDREGRFRQPRGMSQDAAGNVYVVDTGNHRIQKLGPDLTPLAAWGRGGKAPGEFQEPAAVTVGPDGSVYVADTWNGRIQVFDAAGAYQRDWGTGALFSPRGIAVDGEGNVYVADTGNHRIVKYAGGGAQ